MENAWGGWRHCLTFTRTLHPVVDNAVIPTCASIFLHRENAHGSHMAHGRDTGKRLTAAADWAWPTAIRPFLQSITGYPHFCCYRRDNDAPFHEEFAVFPSRVAIFLVAVLARDARFPDREKTPLIEYLGGSVCLSAAAKFSSKTETPNAPTVVRCGTSSRGNPWVPIELRNSRLSICENSICLFRRLRMHGSVRRTNENVK